MIPVQDSLVKILVCEARTDLSIWRKVTKNTFHSHLDSNDIIVKRWNGRFVKIFVGSKIWRYLLTIFEQVDRSFSNILRHHKFLYSHNALSIHLMVTDIETNSALYSHRWPMLGLCPCPKYLTKQGCSLLVQGTPSDNTGKKYVKSSMLMFIYVVCVCVWACYKSRPRVIIHYKICLYTYNPKDFRVSPILRLIDYLVPYQTVIDW